MTVKGDIFCSSGNRKITLVLSDELKIFNDNPMDSESIIREKYYTHTFCTNFWVPYKSTYQKIKFPVFDFSSLVPLILLPGIHHINARKMSLCLVRKMFKHFLICHNLTSLSFECFFGTFRKLIPLDWCRRRFGGGKKG